MDFLQLEALVAIDDHGTFSAAAVVLHVTQPALSRRVAALERELGSPVFQRVGRGVRLTTAGRAAVEAARRILHERQQLLTDVGDVANLGSGELRVAGLPTMITTHLVEALGAFRTRHPGIELHVSGAADSAELLAMVAAARCDVGIVDLPVDRDRLRVVSLGEQELMAVFPPGTALPAPAAGRWPVITESQLRAVPLVGLPTNTSSRHLVDRWFGDSPTRPTFAVTTDLRDLVVPLVLAGAGAALVPDRIAVAAAAAGAAVATIRPRARRRVGLVLREGRTSAAAEAFVQLVRPPG